MLTVASSSPIAQNIISHYQKAFVITKRYSVFLIGTIIWIGITLYYLIQSMSTSQAIDIDIDHIGYKQSGNAVQAAWIYSNTNTFPLANFQASIIAGGYIQTDTMHVSKNNFLSYKWIALPQHLTSPIASEYMQWNSEQQVSSYIQNFIILNTGELNRAELEAKVITWEKVSLIEQFNLSCLNSSLLWIPDFCDHNLEEFASKAFRYDLSYDFAWLESIAKYISNDKTRNTLCQSIVSYEMMSRVIDNRFTSILQTCELSYLQTHQKLQERNKLQEQLQGILTDEVYTGNDRNQFKIASSMQIIQSQIDQGKIDIAFLKSYRNFITKILQNTQLDSFTTNLIYKYHNQYLLKGLQDLLKKVNVDTTNEIINMIDSFDTLNNGDNLNIIWLRYRVSPEVVLATDYASEHPPLGTNDSPVITGSTQSGIDTTVINTLIGAVDISINQGLSQSGTQSQAESWTLTQEVVITQNPVSNGTGSAAPVNTATVTQPIAYQPIQDEEDLNTYKPSTANDSSKAIYDPGNTESKMKAIISDRFLNNLWIKPSTIIIKSSRYFVEREYKSFVFSALLDKENDRKLSPIYVKVDGIRTIIPDFQLYLMDYDRYSQVKFLKNPESYIRLTNQ